MFRFLRLLWFLPLLLPALSACKPGVPDDVLPAGRIEDVLYDYHLAQGLARQAAPDSLDYYTRLYRQAVLAKYDLTEAAFDRSMIWYERHTEQLGKIYERLAERLGDASASRSGERRLAAGERSASGDTLNIWRGSSVILLQSKGVNHYVYTERPDTAVRAGDRLRWEFLVNWYYHEGEREATACMTVYYTGDSVASVYQRLNLTGPQNLTLRVGDRKVERVECFVYQNAPWTERPRLLSLSGVTLYRLRSRTPEAPLRLETPRDTVRTLPVSGERRIRDSLLREDTLNRRRPHFR